MNRRIVAVVGHSGAGKTTLIRSLLRHYVERAQRCAAIKHTHHLITRLAGGDTERFLAAGAEDVVLALAEEAILYTRRERRTPSPTGWTRLEETLTVGDRRIPIFRGPYAAPRELLDIVDAPTVLIEGFRSLHDWPHVVVNRAGIEPIAFDPSVIAVVGDEDARWSVPRFAPDDIERLAGFLDTITAE